jgi:hypothetical protein
MTQLPPSTTSHRPAKAGAAARAYAAFILENLEPDDWPWAEIKRRKRRRRQPTLDSVAKAARKAGIAIASCEIKPDGSIVVVAGTPESTESNSWPLDDFKATKQ